MSSARLALSHAPRTNLDESQSKLHFMLLISCTVSHLWKYLWKYLCANFTTLLIKRLEYLQSRVRQHALWWTFVVVDLLFDGQCELSLRTQERRTL